MKTRWQTLFQKLTAALHDRMDLVLAIMALHHQLAALERSGKRPNFSPADRCFWALLSRVWARWITALAIVHADTVRRWTRQGVRHHLASQRRRQRPGQSAFAAERRTLIRHISRENRHWGAPRLHGERAKLGVCLSRTTVAKYMVRHPRLPGLTASRKLGRTSTPVPTGKPPHNRAGERCLAAILATGQTVAQPLCLVLLAEATGHASQIAARPHLLAEALLAFEASGRGDMLAEAYRLQGECCCAGLSQMRPRPKPVFSKP